MSTVDPQGPLPPYVPAGDDRPPHGNGPGLAALIVGIVALVLAVIPLISVAAFLPAIAAIALGIVGLVLQGRRRGTAITGLILGGVALLVSIVISVITVAGIVTRAAGGISELRSALPTELPSDPTVTGAPPLGPTGTPSPGISLAPGSHTVVYTITGAGRATINYATYAGGDSQSSSGKKRTLPFRKALPFTTSSQDRFASFSAGASQLEPKQPVTCTITVDGRVVSRKTSTTSRIAFVFCSARSSL
jgi:hypothetical protein